MNKLLSNMFEAKVETLEDAKKYIENNKPQQYSESKKKTVRPSTERNFDQKDLDALFGNLKNIEL